MIFSTCLKNIIIVKNATNNGIFRGSQAYVCIYVPARVARENLKPQPQVCTKTLNVALFAPHDQSLCDQIQGVAIKKWPLVPGVLRFSFILLEFFACVPFWDI